MIDAPEHLEALEKAAGQAERAGKIISRIREFVKRSEPRRQRVVLARIVDNLLGNAFKYTRPRERARIEIGWSVDPAVGYTFFVKDNGVGFDTKYAQKLFGVFQRLHRATEFEGTGIGLALTRRILERHGGSIWAESQPGEGSVFHFSLPFEGCSPSEMSPDTSPSVLEP